MIKKATLKLEGYWNDGSNLHLKVNAGFSIQVSSSAAGKITQVKLTVTRKPDKHSTTLGMFAYLHNNEKDYENLGFPSVSLALTTYSDAGKFVSRKIIDFPNAKVDSRLMRGDDEELTFVSNSYKEFEIAEIEVFFD
jgi:hypothetical protein